MMRMLFLIIVFVHIQIVQMILNIPVGKIVFWIESIVF